MYNSGYSQVNLGLAAMKNHRSKGKSCGYYMKIVFFFSSLIQSLIIASLVLFLVYGQPQQTEEDKRIQELEQSYSRLTLENAALRANEKNLTQKLNSTLTAKKNADKELFTFRKLANTSAQSISSLQGKWRQCEVDKRSTVLNPACSPVFCPGGSDLYLHHQLQQTQELLKLVRANFSEIMQIMSRDLENANKAKISHHLEAIELRRDKSFLLERIDRYEKKCKEDFVQPFQGISNITREFLKKVDNLFSKHDSFQLTCDKQSTQLEDIRTNCSSFSREMENKLQGYLDKVGSQVTTTIGENIKYMLENKRLKEDTAWCTRNRSAIIEENKKVLEQIQLKFDQETEKLLLNNRRIDGEKNLQEKLLSVKESEIKMLDAKVKDLNASLITCKTLPKGQFPASPSLFGMPFGTGMGSSGLGTSGQGTSLYGRTAGGSVGSSGIGLGGTGLGLQKTGSVSSVASGSGSPAISSTGLGLPAWPGTGSLGTGVTGLGSAGSGTTGLANPGSSSTAFGSVGAGSMGLSRSTERTGFSSAGSSALTRTGTGGTGAGSSGSSAALSSVFGGGKVTSGSDSLLTAQINQHLKELQHMLIQTEGITRNQT